MDIPRTDRFLFLARFSTIKGASLALEGCIKANTPLDLIGDTSITQEPEYLAKCYKMVDDKRKIHGACSRGECVYWYSQAHCFLHPTKFFREPFGLAPVEAMSCGLPVIGWRYGALKETIVHQETGWLVNSMNELVDIIKNCTITDQMRIRCREQASKFSIQNMCDRYEQLCKEALDGGW